MPFYVTDPFLSFYSTGKIWIPKKKPIEIHQEEATTLDPELEEALSSATDTELHDLAGKYNYRNSQTVLMVNPQETKGAFATEEPFHSS